MAILGLYWWGHGRMPTEKMEVMAKRFFAEVEKHQKNEGRAGMGGNTFANGARILAFSNDEITDTTEIICRGGMDSLTAGREREEIPFSFAAYVI